MKNRYQNVSKLSDAKFRLLIKYFCKEFTALQIADLLHINRNTANDPYNEHDFGAFDYKGRKVFWKIDNYDKAFLYLSPDACNPRLTNKVLTIMYADEY